MIYDGPEEDAKKFKKRMSESQQKIDDVFTILANSEMTASEAWEKVFGQKLDIFDPETEQGKKLDEVIQNSMRL